MTVRLGVDLGLKGGPFLGLNAGGQGRLFLPTQAEWEALLGITLHFGFDAGGGFPYLDFVGSNDLDVDATPSGSNAAPWPQGGTCHLATTGADRIQTTNTGFLLPSTDNFLFQGMLTRGPALDDGNAGLWQASNGNLQGIRMIHQHGAVQDRIFFTCENQSAVANSCTISIGGRYSADQVLYYTVGRVSTTLIAFWLSDAGSDLTLHEELIVLATDDYSDVASVFGIGRNTALGNANPGTKHRGGFYSRGQAPSLALHDIFRGDTTLVVTEA